MREGLREPSSPFATWSSPGTPGRTRLAALLVLALFCAPLFFGLGRTDFKGDEPIYSFAVDLMLETGDWLTPRSIPHEDAAFLEKPPLKFWIVAGGIRAGLLPHDEFGQSFWDALFGAMAFLYVFAIGLRLGGPLCGIVAVCTLFVHRPLLFEHGVRSNNMEGPLLLGYCGAVYHALAWSTATTRLARRLHPQAVVAFFVLGFMTKFVAAIFLPFILVVTALTFAHWRMRLREDWLVWGGAVLLGILVTVPWFVYQTNLQGRVFWEVLLAEHVYKRMTTFLDASHLKPWHYYLTTAHAELRENGTFLPVLVGTAVLAFHTVRRRWDVGTLILLWFAVPFVAISFGSSKLYHYAYPFLPPLALGAGYLPAILLHRDSPARRRLEQTGDRLADSQWLRRLHHRMPRLSRIATAGAVIAFGVAVATLVIGRFGIRIGDVLIFRNASVTRPVAIGIILLLLGSWGKLAGRLVLVLVLVATVPVDGYRVALERLDDRDEPMQILTTCLKDLMPHRRGPGVYIHAEDTGQWRYLYYFRELGWQHPPERSDATLAQKVFGAGEEQPVLLTSAELMRFQAALASGLRAPSEPDGRASDVSRLQSVRRFQFDDGLLLLLPGRYGVCAGPQPPPAPVR